MTVTACELLVGGVACQFIRSSNILGFVDLTKLTCIISFIVHTE